MLPRISVKSPSHLGWLRLPLKLIDLLFLPSRLTVHCVLKPFDHRFKVLEASLDELETLRNRLVRLTGIATDAS